MTVYVPDDRWTPQLLYVESQLFYASGQWRGGTKNRAMCRCKLKSCTRIS